MTEKIRKILMAIFFLIMGIAFWIFGFISTQYYAWEKGPDMVVIGMAFFVIGCIYSIVLLSSN